LGLEHVPYPDHPPDNFHGFAKLCSWKSDRRVFWIVADGIESFRIDRFQAFQLTHPVLVSDQINEPLEGTTNRVVDEDDVARIECRLHSVFLNQKDAELFFGGSR
jgi:hypothetical protein